MPQGSSQLLGAVVGVLSPANLVIPSPSRLTSYAETGGDLFPVRSQLPGDHDLRLGLLAQHMKHFCRFVEILHGLLTCLDVWLLRCASSSLGPGRCFTSALL